MSETENEKLIVHKDISSRFKSPYWYIEVNRKPKFPLNQYKTPVQNQSNENDIDKIGIVQYPCGYCMFSNPKLIRAHELMSNSGGWKSHEFRCGRCGVYTYYEEKDFG